MKATVHATIQGVWVRRVRDCYVSPPTRYPKIMEHLPLVPFLESLRIQVCPKTSGFPPKNPILFGWDVLTINPTKNREGSSDSEGMAIKKPPGGIFGERPSFSGIHEAHRLIPKISKFVSWGVDTPKPLPTGSIRVFPKIGGKPPKWMVKIMENPNKCG